MDEADKMIDMGLEEQVNQILGLIPPHINKDSTDEAAVYRQEEEMRKNSKFYKTVWMFSATFEPKVEKMTKSYLTFPSHVCIGTDGATKKNIL
jgi:ATP-dependent RNA helicase DDX23/PRP28